jgi:hypothetical protein
VTESLLQGNCHTTSWGLLHVWHERAHFFVSGSARIHRHGEQRHEGRSTMKDGRAEHSGLTERPILNEFNVISAEGSGDEWDSRGPEFDLDFCLLHLDLCLLL